MDTIVIRKYKVGDYDEVNRLFITSFKDYVKNGIIGGIKTRKPLYILLFLFLYGCVYSINYGVILLFIGIFVHSACVTLVYTIYLW